MTYYTTRVAAKELGLTERRVRQMIAEKLIPAKMYGTEWLIDEDDLGIAMAQRVRARRDRRRK